MSTSYLEIRAVIVYNSSFRHVSSKNGCQLGTAAAAPPPFRPSDPALCGSCPLVAPYYCRLGDLLCLFCVYRFVCHYCLCICVFCCFRFFSFSFVASLSVLWYCWLGLLTCKNRLPYNLYCVGGDVKQCSLTHATKFWRNVNNYVIIMAHIS